MKDIISKELLSEVLGKKVGYIDSNLSYFEENSSCVLGVTINGIKKYWNIHELAYKCKNKVREWEYIIKSGFNEDIIEDDGSVALDCLEVDRYEVRVKRIVHNYKDTMQDKIVTVAQFGGENLPQLEIKACQWILENIE